MQSRILVADDQLDVLEAIRLLLSQHSFALELVTSPGAVLQQLQNGGWDLLLMDLNYSRDTTSGAEGLELLSRVRAGHPGLPVVVMTAWGNVDLAVDAMRAGAQSFVQKPWDNAALVQIVQREVADARAARQRGEERQREQQDALLIQRNLLPARLPCTDCFDIVGIWQPALGFGGDCYDAFLFTPDIVGVSIADVAGKGLPAALLMSSLQAAVRAFALESSPPQAICASVNRLLCSQMVMGRFVTFAYLRLDAARGTIAYANAGHNPPLLVGAGGAVSRLEATGTVMGVFPDAAYSSGEARLARGDRLVLYTDGITEARSPADEEFGERRLTDLIVQHRGLSAADLHATILQQAETFTSGGFQDDATLIVVAVK